MIYGWLACGRSICARDSRGMKLLFKCNSRRRRSQQWAADLLNVSKDLHLFLWSFFVLTRAFLALGRRESLARLRRLLVMDSNEGKKRPFTNKTTEDLLLLLLPREQYIGMSQSEKLNVHNHIFTSFHWISFFFTSLRSYKIVRNFSLTFTLIFFFFLFAANFQSLQDNNCEVIPFYGDDWDD